MRVLVLHNPGAGNGNDERPALLSAMREHGYEPLFCSTAEAGWKQTLRESGARLIAVVGGDGTVAKVLRRLPVDAPPVAIVPKGSANNIAASLGIGSDELHWIGQWRQAQVHRFRRPTIRAGGRQRLFIEAVGLGVFPEVIGAPDAESASGEAKIAHGSDAFVRCLRQFTPRQWRVELDGRPIDADTIMLEVLNVPQIGPRLNLSPGMQPGSDWLDVVCVPLAQRAALVAQLDSQLPTAETRAVLTVHRARRIVIHPLGSPLHVDDKLWSRRLDADARVEISAGSASLRLLRPAAAHGPSTAQ